MLEMQIIQRQSLGFAALIILIPRIPVTLLEPILSCLIYGVNLSGDLMMVVGLM